jgi:hypothetical protein
MINFFKELKLCPSMECFSLKIDYQWLSIKNVEEYLKIVKLNLFGIVVNADIHLLSGCETAFSWLDLEYSLLQNVSLKGLLLSGLSWIGPWLKLNFVIIWHFELPFRRYSPNVFQRKSDLPWL